MRILCSAKLYCLRDSIRVDGVAAANHSFAAAKYLFKADLTALGARALLHTPGQPMD